MKILILGAPGSGKGTYSKGLSEILKIPHISTGDLCREEVATGSELGEQIKAIMDKGGLISDDMMMNMLKKRLEHTDAKKGYILDGFPRNIKQVEKLEKLTNFDLVINLMLPDSILIKKNLGRRTCNNCGPIYNVVEINEQGIHMPALLPKREGICDKCGSPLFIRADDSEEIMRERLKIYWERTRPVLEFYKKKGLVRDVRVDSSPDIMVPKILKMIKKELDVK